MSHDPGSWKKHIEDAIASMRSVLSQNIVDIPEDERRSLCEDLSKIESKLSENRLKIAMLGEFASGKSTFINALLREKILKSAPGATTAAITEIMHGSDDIIVYKEGSSWKRYSDRGDAVIVDKDFKNFLKKYQADNDAAKDVSRLVITLDRDILDNEAVILDTPGFNSGNADHQSKIEQVMDDEADAGVIMFSSQFAAELSNLEFLENYKHHLKNVFFVITKSDYSDQEGQTDQVLSNVRTKIRKYFKWDKNPEVIALAPLKALKNSSGKYFDDFCLFEQRLLKFTKTRKKFIILGRILDLIATTIEKLKTYIEQNRVEADKLRKAIDATQKAFPDDFISEKIEKARNDINAAVESLQCNIEKNVTRAFKRNESRIAGLINRKDTSELEGIIRQAFDTLQNELERIMESEAIAPLKNTAVAFAKQFEEDFKKEYRELNQKLQGAASIEFKQIKIDLPKLSFGNFDGIRDEFETLLTETIDTLSGLFFRIGDFLLGGKKYEQKKKEIEQKIKDNMAAAQKNYWKKFEKHLQKAAEQFREHIVEQSVDHYAREFTEEIEKSVKKIEITQKNIERRINEIKTVENQLSEIQQNICQEQDRLNLMETFVRQIETGDVNINEETLQKIDPLIDTIGHFDYSESLHHLLRSKTDQSDSIFDSYLMGCLTRLDKKNPDYHFSNCINRLLAAQDQTPLLGMLNHLAGFNIDDLCQTYYLVNYERASVQVKNCFAKACATAQKNDYATAISYLHMKQLVNQATNNIDLLINKLETLENNP